MFQIWVKNEKGQTMELTNNPAYVVYNVLGMDPADAVINTNRNASTDGSVFNSAYIDNKEITLTMALNYPAEANRINLYKYFRNKEPIKLFFKTDSRDVFIDGYCQRVNVNLFEKKEIAQVTILCSNPYFKAKDAKTVQISQNQGLFEFPFSIQTPIPFSEISNTSHEIINTGDIKVGAIFRITANGYVDAPKIINVDTNEYFLITAGMNAGEVIEINTIQNERSVLMGDGQSMSDYIYGMSINSTWLELDVGENHFAATADSNPENMDVEVEFRAYYEGV
jgi:hypothetical protein